MIVYHGSGQAIETPDLVHSRKAVVATLKYIGSESV